MDLINHGLTDVLIYNTSFYTEFVVGSAIWQAMDHCVKQKLPTNA